MMVIPHTTRTNWKQSLTEDYNLDEDTASTLIGLIKGDPRLATARPRTREELEQLVAQLEQVLNEIDFSEFEGIDDEQALRDDLLEAVKIDFGLVEDPQKLVTRAVKSDGREREKVAESLGFVAAENPDETLEDLKIGRKHVETLVKRVQQADEDNRRRAARALGEVITAGATNTAEMAEEQLRERVENSSGQASEAAAQALGHLSTATAGLSQPETTDGIDDSPILGAAERGLAADFHHREEPTGEPPERLEEHINGYTKDIREGEMDLEQLKEDFAIIIKWVEHRLEEEDS